jgi:CMP/dCMP kinase
VETKQRTNSQPLHIAIDGLVATGKTTVGMKVAERLRILFLDTGVLYRAITLFILETGIDMQSEHACSLVANGITIKVMPPTVQDNRPATVLLGKQDVTWDIRSKDVDHFVPTISAHPKVRAAVRERQHEIAETQPVVMVGRDIATVVLPNAQVKVMLTANLEERVRRRYQEIQAREFNVSMSLGDLRQDIISRDADDSIRVLETSETQLIATDNRTIDDIVSIIVTMAYEALRETTLKLPTLERGERG